ncbi:MAG: MBL fold metallo-hydrolase [Acidobacteria bacterium]|nr:MAG: MBL fold metallo-hydrolase [Acidobacteriota bacterium]
MRVIFLGTGNAFASGGRNAMAILLLTDGLGVLLDCGPTTLVALKKLGLSPSDVDVILLSHHHGDHFAGVPFLVLHERYDGSRTKPLSVYGPEGTREKLTQGLEWLFPGIGTLPFALEYCDQKPGDVLRAGAFEARPFEVDHYSRGTAFGYRVSLDGKVVVFSGDTAWTEALVTQTAGADLFICECSSFERPLEKHMTHRDLERHQARIGAKRTLLVHAGDDVLERERDLVFELAYDGMEVTL